jgi:hypothetical protein
VGAQDAEIVEQHQNSGDDDHDTEDEPSGSRSGAGELLAAPFGARVPADLTVQIARPTLFEAFHGLSVCWGGRGG